MRTIKFRAWDTKNKEMIIDTKFCMQAIADERYCGYGEDLVLMQFTGLLDKNGVEIYEGDIVKYTRTNGKGIVAEIVWNFEDSCYYYFNHKDPVDTDVSNKESTFFVASTTTEVIGNIYENPELLPSP